MRRGGGGGEGGTGREKVKKEGAAREEVKLRGWYEAPGSDFLTRTWLPPPPEPREGVLPGDTQNLEARHQAWLCLLLPLTPVLSVGQGPAEGR